MGLYVWADLCGGRAQNLKPDKLICGAKARSTGNPCQCKPVMTNKTIDGVLKVVPRNGRCRLHGGNSTGAKTEDGKRRVLEAVQRRWLQAKTREREPNPMTRENTAASASLAPGAALCDEDRSNDPAQ